MLVSFARTIILYIGIIVVLRVLGKRQLGELEPSELVVTILISELAAIPMQDSNIPLWQGIIPILTLLGIELLLSWGILKSIRLRKWACGTPSVLVQNGKLLEKELSRNRISIDEVIEELRLQNITDISTVHYGILETSGKLSVILYPDKSPVTREDMNQHPEVLGLPMVLISDGRWLDKNIQMRGVTRDWVLKELKTRGVGDRREVFLLMVDEQHNIYMQETSG